MFKFFKKDSFVFGIAIGIILPFAIFGILHFIVDLFHVNGSKGVRVLQDSTLQLIAIFINMFVLRYYLLKLKYDKTGRGVLFSTFICAIIYFALIMVN